ncbi:RNA-directed DNA polymerase, eukaryota [Tanacetum coccineum]
MGHRFPSSFQSKYDQTSKVSKSVYVSNFPDDCSSKDLWKACNSYGNVVDVFIPNKKAKSGKRFAFVRFIKVNHFDRLIENLNTIWIGRLHLFANPVRYERPNANPTHKGFMRSNDAAPGFRQPKSQVKVGSFANVVIGNRPLVVDSSPALVLDESCVVDRNLEFFVLGETNNASSIPNLYSILSNEGFNKVNVSYLGGLWVMIELDSIKSKEKFLHHDGVASWFKSLGNAQADFVAKERIVWVDIEGVPIHAWSRATFVKIGSKWGDVVEIEESKDDLFARKRICIKTKQEDNILDKFKIIVKGRVFVVRAKELFMWSPSFKVDNESNSVSDVESSKDADEDTGDVNKNASSDLESDSDAVSDTFFGEFNDNPDKEQSLNQPQNVEAASLDPFNIYPLLDRKNIGTSDSVSDKSIPFPPGFTPPEDYTKPDDQVSKDKSPGSSQRRSESFCSRIMEECQQDYVQQLPVDSNSGFYSGFNENGLKKGGSLLDVLDGMVKVGQTMGYDMGGCMKDMEKIIGSQGVRDVIQ